MEVGINFMMDMTILDRLEDDDFKNKIIEYFENKSKTINNVESLNKNIEAFEVYKIAIESMYNLFIIFLKSNDDEIHEELRELKLDTINPVELFFNKTYELDRIESSITNILSTRLYSNDHRYILFLKEFDRFIQLIKTAMIR